MKLLAEQFCLLSEMACSILHHDDCEFAFAGVFYFGRHGNSVKEWELKDSYITFETLKPIANDMLDFHSKHCDPRKTRKKGYKDIYGTIRKENSIYELDEEDIEIFKNERKHFIKEMKRLYLWSEKKGKLDSIPDSQM
jgi:hypothetical protein